MGLPQLGSRYGGRLLTASLWRKPESSPFGVLRNSRRALYGAALSAHGNVRAHRPSRSELWRHQPDELRGLRRIGTGRLSAGVSGGVVDAGGEREDGVGGGVPAPGVAGVSGLHRPENFLPLAVAAVSESDRLRAGISSGTISDPLSVLRAVDGISNAVCTVIDAADFLRNAHADRRFRDAADEAFSHLAEYIQELNADDAIYRALCRVVSDDKAMEGLTEEQRRVARMHMAEYERGGIHLSPDDRARVVELQNEAARLERLYEHNIVAKRGAYQVPRDHLQGIPAYVLSRIPQPQGQPGHLFTLVTDQSVVGDVLRSARSGAVRRAAYLAGNAVAEENVKVLEQLMAVRDALAKKVGFESHAHRATSDKMAESPAEVARFLDALSSATKGRADHEMAMLREAKQEVEGSSELFAWDIPYYMGLVKARRTNLSGTSLSEYFTLGACLEGLQLVCGGLFGISLEQVPMRQDENWASSAPVGAGGEAGGVRKLIARHETEGVLGTVYLDLHRREGKYGHAAHFTVRCGCIADAGGNPAGTGASGAGDAGEKYQLPIVVLVCNFALPEAPSDAESGIGSVVELFGQGGGGRGAEGQPEHLMSHSEAETFFHEFGHALHSLLSRTEFQHVSGTRVPVDFCEIPSHLMEHFVWDQRVLTEFARHYKTGEPPPREVLDRLRESKTFFVGLETRTQLMYAALDQKLFGVQPHDGVWPSTPLAKSLREEITGVRCLEESPWHSRFGHFTGYGAGYYAYLYAKMFSSAIWRRHFAGDPLSREAGELLWKELLMHGGARDPHGMLEVLLGEIGSGSEDGIRAGVKSLLEDMGIEPGLSQ